MNTTTTSQTNMSTSTSTSAVSQFITQAADLSTTALSPKQNLYLSATFQSKQPARQQLVEVMLQLQIQVLCNMDFKYLNFDSALNPLLMLTHVHVHVNLKKNSFVV